MSEGHVHYLAGWPDADGWNTVLTPLCTKAGLPVMDLPEGLRLRDTATERFWFNYAAHEVSHAGQTYAPASVTRESLTE